MSPVLVTREELNSNRDLMHYRTEGSKNGQRLYQYKDGSLTPLGRIHYGVGQGRDRSSGGAISMLVGKKQVNSDGTLTKQGRHNVEETLRDSSFMSLSDKDKKHGKAKEREKAINEYKDEVDSLIKEYTDKHKNDPSFDFSKEEPHLRDIDRKMWEKYQDKYAEATLKDLNLPINEANKGVVKDAFKRYDEYYEYGSRENHYSPEGQEHAKIVKDNRDKRFKSEEPSTKEIKKDVEDKINNFNETVKTSKEERVAENKERNERLKDEIKEIRSLADEELDKRIARLQKEKQLAELINERNNQEKSELHRRASKIFKDAAENLARRALNVATDELLNKYKNRMNNTKSDSGNNKTDGGSKSSNDSSKPKDGSSGGSGKFSKEEKSRIRSMAGSGKSVADIAKALGVDESKVKGFMASAGITIS